MNEFDALMRSLLEQCVDYIRQDVDLRALRVTADSLTDSAHIEIVLTKDLWQQQQKVIDHMVDIRAMFIDELALDYSFVSMEDLGDLPDVAGYRRLFQAA